MYLSGGILPQIFNRIELSANGSFSRIECVPL